MSRAIAPRDVLFLDVHGVFLTAATVDEPSVPLVGRHRHQKWTEVVRNVLQQANTLPLQIEEALLESQALWKLRVKLELTTPRTRQGRVVKERRFHEQVNLRLLKTVAPTFMDSLDSQQQIRLARQVRKLRQDTARYRYFLEDEMCKLVQELACPWMFYLTTAGTKAEVEREFRAEEVELSLFAKVFRTEQVGLPKSHPDFWRTLAKRVKMKPRQCVVVEDNLVMGLNAVRAGMSVIFYDRQYGLEGFIRKELEGKVHGVPLSRVEEEWSSRQPFVVCAKSVAEIRLCLQRAQTSSAGAP